tara:strand:- start:6336 stop:7034 length:699 start_codon:yes stop_codon:yes gene_type:complete
MKPLNKTAAALAIVLGASSLSATAGGYDVSRFWASGENWTLRYDEALSEDNGSLTITHDEENEVVTFSVVWSQFQHTDSCSVSPDSMGDGDFGPVGHVYFEALDILDNIELIQEFRVRSWGDTCEDLSRVSYREDITKTEFTCENGDTYWGQSVYVVGNTAALGNWDPAKAVKLDPTNYPTWSGSLVVENDTDIEWKCIKRDENNPGQGVEWEWGANNFFNSGNTDETFGQF